MNPLPPFGIFLQVASAVVSLAIILFFLLRARRTPLLRSYLWFQLLILIWSCHELITRGVYTYALEFMASKPQMPHLVPAWADYVLTNFGVTMKFLPRCFIGLGWLVFCLHYTNHRLAGKKKALRWLAVPTALSFLFCATNPWHQMFFYYTSPGPVFWFSIAVTYTYLIMGVIILGRQAAVQEGTARRQSMLFLVAMSIPFALNMIQDFYYIVLRAPFPVDFDTPPLGFLATSIIFAFAAFKYKFVNIMPFALQTAFSNINEAIIVVDSNNRIADFNRLAAERFPWPDDLRVDGELAAFLRTLSRNFRAANDEAVFFQRLLSGDPAELSGEISRIDTEPLTLAIKVQPVTTNRGRMTGRLITFSDVTEYRRLLAQAEEHNIRLATLNKQLAAYAAVVEELTLAKERNRFARDIHDTLGQTMTLLIALLETAALASRENPQATEKQINEAIKLAREGMKEVRRSVVGLAAAEAGMENAGSALSSLVAKYQALGAEIELYVDGTGGEGSPEAVETVYRICQEAMTNSLRHGKAKHIAVMLRFIPGRASLFIIDDGQGCRNIHPGFGLTGMEQRVRNLGGSIEFGSDGESGFNIRVELPWGGSIA